MQIWGIVVAAGAGRRFGGAKQHVELAGVPLWQRAVEVLRAGGVHDVVVVGDVPGGVPGGERRRDSVAAGLAALPATATHVLVHDAARALATPELVTRVIAALTDGSDAVIPVVAVRDTLKRVDGTKVVETVDRSDLVAVQTPQGFGRAVLEAAHRDDADDATDDAALVERAGVVVTTVEGDPANLKVTYPEDLAVATALLAARL